jgi:hypothetical protein
MRSVNLGIGRGERGNGMREAMAAKLDKSRIKGKKSYSGQEGKYKM